MGSQQTIEPQSNFVKIPSNYPKIPEPGKLELLWDRNNHSLYHKLSPYTDINQSLVTGITNQEPFYYVYPDQNTKGLNALTKYESRLFPIGAAPIDVIRVTKFLASGNGIIFLGKQFLLQSGNAYNETRIYNPTSPIVAAGMGLALGSVRPQRNFDTSAGLQGLASTLIGSTIPNALFGSPKINPPAGTVASALPDSTLTSGGKGLLRAGTANSALNNLQTAWPQANKGQSNTGTFLSSIAAAAKQMFANYIPANQNGILARSDEGAYGMMIGAGSTKFEYIGTRGGAIGFGQQWIAGGTNIRKSGQYPNTPYRLFTNFDGTILQISNDNLESMTIPGLGAIGYEVNESTDTNSPGFRYGDNVGVENDSDYKSSDMMVQYSEYVDKNNDYPTKQTTTTAIQNLNDTLLSVLNDIAAVNNGLYKINVPNDARVISSGKSSLNGYDRLFATNKPNVSPMNYPLGLMQDYRNSKVVDNSLTLDPINLSVKLPGAGNFDAINTLTVLPSDKSILNSKLKGWTAWQPYTDDQIALYFYDVVNSKYIPFRAAIKGIGDTSNANWNAMSFIGRADSVYSYGGFTRTMSLTINVNINSIAELAPTWQRINYLTTLVKPSNYTTGGKGSTSKFTIPPMVMLTLGDMYKDQPILFQSITVTIPDDASWETSNEFNSGDWSYLAGYITSPNILYGQLPRSIDISLGIILLEKERAIVGGANFGHAPRTDDLTYWNVDSIPDSGEPNKFNQSLVVPQDRPLGTAIYSKEDVDAIAYSNTVPEGQ